MNLLLDTNVVLFTLSEPERLSKEFVRLIESPSNQVFVSSLTMWEIVTKVQIGKLQMLDNFAEQIRDIGITTVDFSEKDAMEIFNLPLHHRDLFDRGLLAQARRLQLRLLTSDILLGSYSGLVDVLLMS